MDMECCIWAVSHILGPIKTRASCCSRKSNGVTIVHTTTNHGLVVATATVVRGLSSVQLSVSASGHQSAAARTHGARHGEAAARRAPRTWFCRPDTCAGKWCLQEQQHPRPSSTPNDTRIPLVPIRTPGAFRSPNLEPTTERQKG
jgi:hypothetical protein